MEKVVLGMHLWLEPVNLSSSFCALTTFLHAHQRPVGAGNVCLSRETVLLQEILATLRISSRAVDVVPNIHDFQDVPQPNLALEILLKITRPVCGFSFPLLTRPWACCSRNVAMKARLLILIFFKFMIQGSDSPHALTFYDCTNSAYQNIPDKKPIWSSLVDNGSQMLLERLTKTYCSLTLRTKC